MSKKMKYKKFDTQNIRDESILELDEEHLSSPDKFISFVQHCVNQTYHVIIARAQFDGFLHSTNLSILFSHDINATSNKLAKLCCQNSTLKNCAINKLLKYYPKIKKSKEILM